MDSEEGNGASQHPCSSDVALRKIEELERRLNILEGKMPLMVTNTVCQEIKPITKAGDKRWKTMVAHARTCKIDDKKMYHHKSSTKPHTDVIYDCVGELKGVIDESHFVPIDNLSADEKDHACKLLSLVLEPSAFVDRYNTSYDDEASLVQQYPCKPSNINSSTNCSIQLCWNENINGFQTAEAGCSSQSISPNNIYDESLVSRGVGPIPGPENIPMDLDDGMNGVEPRTLSEIFEADPNDMDPVQLNGGCQTSYEYNEAWIEEFIQSHPTCFVDEYSHIEMSNGDDERAAAGVVNASIRWKQLFCVVTWTFSSSRRVLSVSVGHPPKRKKQRVG